MTTESNPVRKTWLSSMNILIKRLFPSTLLLGGGTKQLSHLYLPGLFSDWTKGSFMQYIVDNCGITGLLSCVTLPSKTTVHSSDVEQPVLRAVELLASVVLPWLSLTCFFCADGEENLSTMTLKSAVDHDGVKWAGKLCPSPGQLLQVDTSDTAHAENTSGVFYPKDASFNRAWSSVPAKTLALKSMGALLEYGASLCQ